MSNAAYRWMVKTVHRNGKAFQQRFKVANKAAKKLQKRAGKVIKKTRKELVKSSKRGLKSAPALGKETAQVTRARG